MYAAAALPYCMENEGENNYLLANAKDYPEPENIALAVASVADFVLAEHRKRFPLVKQRTTPNIPGTDKPIY